MRRLCGMLALLGGLSMAAGLWGQTTEPPASTASAPAPIGPKLADLIHRLGDPDPATRKTAQDDLGKTDWHDLEALRQAAEQTNDAEAKAQFTARVESIEDDLAVNPPPVSLHLKDASTDDMNKAFSKVAGLSTPYIPWPPIDARNGQPPELYTLDAVDEPLWQVFMELSRQHGLYLQGWDSNQQIMHNMGTGWRHGEIFGPLLVVLDNITYTRGSNLQDDAPGHAHTEHLSLSGSAAIDPRIRILRYTQPMFTEITDDAGNTLLTQPPNDILMTTMQRQAAWALNGDLKIVDKPGKNIALAKGYVHLVVEVRSMMVDIEDAANKVGGAFSIGRFTVNLTKLDAKPGSISLNLSMTNSAGVLGGFARIVGGQPDQTQLVTCTLMDSTGKQLNSVRLSAGSSAGSGIGTQFTAPLKLRLTVPTKIKDVIIPFELKNLPLP